MGVPIRGTLLDSFGRPISGATATVYKRGTLTLASLYSDFDLTAAAANPITTEADGSYFAYAPNGFYDLVFAKSGHTFDATDSVNELVYDPMRNRTVTTTSVTIDERDYILFFDASVGNQTGNLPALTGSGRVFFIVKVDASANTVTLDGSGAETINGAATFVLSDQYDSVFIFDRAGGWIAFPFDSSTVTSILDLRLPVVIKTASYTLTRNDHIVIGNSGSAISFTLPVITTVSGGGFAKEYWIRNIGAGALTIVGTVDGNTNPVLATGESIIIYGDGTTWRTQSSMRSKGDLLSHDGLIDKRLPAGTNGYALIANAAQALGLEWIPPFAHVEWFGSSGTWNTKSWVSTALIIAQGGGGGGGAGGGGNTIPNSGGGGGGGAAGELSVILAAPAASSAITVTVGGGGAGGTGVAGASGNAGTIGGTTTVGALATAAGGNPGAGGITGSPGTGGAGGFSPRHAAGGAGGGTSAAGSSTSTGDGGTGGSASAGSGGGGGGAAGGPSTWYAGGGGGAGGAAATNGAAAGGVVVPPAWGTGGGGGGGAGGTGGSQTGGAGSAGGQGFAIIIWW